jgi:hypothetical protein
MTKVGAEIIKKMAVWSVKRKARRLGGGSKEG